MAKPSTKPGTYLLKYVHVICIIVLMHLPYVCIFSSNQDIKYTALVHTEKPQKPC